MENCEKCDNTGRIGIYADESPTPVSYERCPKCEGLTPEERAMLEKVNAEKHIAIPSRKSIMHRPENFEELKILKSLVYKDLISFSVCFDSRCYLFISRKHIAKF